MKKPNLKPCPFCNRTVYIQIHDDEGNFRDGSYLDDPWSGVSYSISHTNEKSKNCPIATHPEEILGSILYSTVEEAEDAWNNRHSEVKLFIRIGEISENEQSNIYSEIDDITVIDREKGVSVYECVLNLENQYQIIMPLPFKIGQGRTYERLMNCIINKERDIYLLAGDIVGKGTDNEYLIKNVQVIKKLFVD